MTDDELRAIVRAAIAQCTAAPPALPGLAPPGVATTHLHSSHGLFTLLPVGSDADGPCLIEPAVTCNHCGYCQSYGH